MKKVLIANRGEIAVRIAKGCAALGIQTVAVFSEADAQAAHRWAADESVCIGPAKAAESYLVASKLLAAAAETGADAIHPGYGFLSENEAFARAVTQAGLIWIGPPPDAIASMGSKINARATMTAAGVPVVPGMDRQDAQFEDLAGFATDIGYPVLVKASLGGGGKGMRAVHEPESLEAAVAGCQREAAAAFGDGTVYIEKLLLRPRHIEIQVFADAHGNVVHLGERECSIQRRHQKVVEEAPSPALTQAVRDAMGDAAVSAARAVGYVGAGTVEFLYDDASGGFYFLEMNTRLQVEHPVTEEVFGVDLVAAQLKVARGEELPWKQTDLAVRGHAIEVRLYAEDATKGFLPATGTLVRYRPPNGPGIRHDTGVYEGAEVSVHYDPMLAKLIAYGETREAAVGRMSAALAAWEIHGAVTNLPFLAAIVDHPAFKSGDTHTGFLPEHFPDGLTPSEPDDLAWVALALDAAAGGAKAAVGSGANEGQGGGDWVSPWRVIGGLS